MDTRDQVGMALYRAGYKTRPMMRPPLKSTLHVDITPQGGVYAVVCQGPGAFTVTVYNEGRMVAEEQATVAPDVVSIVAAHMHD